MLLLNSSNGSSVNAYDQVDSKNIVLYTHKDTVYAKTKGQKKYHESILNNDIVFAIGPAGTGKTYTIAQVIAQSYP